MKINVKEMSYEDMQKLPRLKHKKPMRPQMWLATVVRIICAPTLKKIKFSYTEERMELAKDLLRHTDAPILDVAFDCGFNNISHFNRLFKRG